MQNATLLSIVYLAVSLTVEAGRRFTSLRFAERASLALEAFPARALDMAGLLQPLRRALVEGEVNAFWVRVVFGVTSVLVIFGLAATVGVLMWVARWAWDRSRPARVP